MSYRLAYRRVLLALVSLWLLLTFIFFAIDLLPGDPAQMLLGQEATPEALDNLRHSMGLDVPVYQRYADWLWHIVRGQFGVSVVTGRDISRLVFGRLLNTLFLASLTAFIAVPLGLVLGILAVQRRNSLFDRAAAFISIASISLPDYLVAYAFILVFSIEFDLFPAVSLITPNTSLVERIYGTLLPALTLAPFVATHIMRMTRAAIIDILSTAYIEMAHLKGLRLFDIIFYHALPNAWAPIINVIVFNLAYLITGVVIVEVVFAYPGLGQLLVDFVSRRDIPVVQASSLIFALLFMALNLFADVIVILTNPRLRYS